MLTASCGDTGAAPGVPRSLVIVGLASTSLFVGDVLHVEARVVPAVAAAEIVWQSSNNEVVRVAADGGIRAVRRGSAILTVRSRDLVTELALDVHDLPPRYSDSELAYFEEVALGTESGRGSARVRKWTSAPRIQAFGRPTADDLHTLDRIVDELNALVPGLGAEITVEGPTVEIHFVPADEFPAYEPRYEKGNLGFFWVWWNDAQEITYARVLIATEDVTQRVREHLLREELTQVLGLMRDSWTYPESIFYQGWTETGVYAQIDRSLVEMLYRPDVLPGQPRDVVLETLRAARVSSDSVLVPYGHQRVDSGDP